MHSPPQCHPSKNKGTEPRILKADGLVQPICSHQMEYIPAQKGDIHVRQKPIY